MPVSLTPSVVLARQADDGRRLALFDLDRTLIPGSSLMAVARAMRAAGELSAGTVALAAARNARFRRRGIDDHGTARVRDGVLAGVAGRPVAPLAALAERVGLEVAATATPAARWLVARHRDAGDRCVVLSAAPQEVVAVVARAFGADAGIGTCGEVDADGRYTGRLAGPFCHGPGKLERLAALLGALDLADASAYGDSVSDLPVLEACGHPVAVNPDRRLAAHARARRWPVLQLG